MIQLNKEVLTELYNNWHLQYHIFFISFSKCVFSRIPQTKHMNVLNRIIHNIIIKGTPTLGLHLSPSFIDNLLLLKRQPTLSQFSVEVEYHSVTNVVTESCWLKNLLLEFHCSVMNVILVYCDNICTIYLFGNSVQHQRTTHI